MNQIKEGDYVGRISYNMDIDFVVDRIINLRGNRKLAILKGVNIRIEADSYLEDLRIIDKKSISKKRALYEQNLKQQIEKNKTRYNERIYTGRILHLDGDSRYSQKSLRYYKKLSLNAVVKNIPESRQSYNVVNLIKRYRPDIIVITGHDALLKNGRDYSNIYNYRNSKYFIETVKQARKYNSSMEELVIFAGACQSYYEGIMRAGANFASSPARIMIDFIDPLVVAEKVATTEASKFITIKDIRSDLRDGEAGIGGIGAFGKKKIL